ncbi:MAG: Jag N-terminal domain-containing protein, partial [Phototrophicaceae bacterium]
MDTKDYVEATGDNVEAAIAAGLEQLGVGPNDVMVEILEEPSRGVFGIGAKPARVRLRMLRPSPPPPVEPAEPAPAPPAREASVDFDDMDDDDDGDSEFGDFIEDQESPS